MSESSQKLPSRLIAISIVLAPLTSIESLIDPKLASRHFLVATLTALLILFSIFKARKLAIYNNWLYWCFPFFVLFISYCVSYHFAFNQGEAGFWVGKIGVYFSLFTVLLLLRYNRLLYLKIIARAVLVGILVSLLLFIFEANDKQLLKTTTLIDKNLYALSSPFGHKNLYASYLVISLPFLAYLILISKNIKRLFYALVLLIGLGMIMVLQAKAAILGLMTGVLFLLPGILYYYRRNNKKVFRLLLVGGSLILISSLSVIYIFQDYFSLLFQTASTKERILVWKNTVNMIQEFPFTGVGGGNWQLFFPKYGLNAFHVVNEKVHLGYQTFQRPHNDFLWVFSEAGILGVVAYISIFAGGLFGAFKSYKKLDSLKERSIPLLFSLGVIAFFIISFFDFPLERSEHVFIFILLLVFCIPLSKKNYKGKNTLLLLLILFPLLFTSTFSGFNTLERMTQEEKHLKVLIAHRKGDWQAMLSDENKTNSHTYEIDNFSIPREWYRGVALYSIGDLEESRKAFENAYQLAPYQVHVINNLAGLYQNMGDHKKAINLYDKALNIASFHSEILLNKSVALYNEKEVEAAFNNLLKIEYKKEHPENYHRGMKTIFNTYLKELKDNKTDTYSLKSLNNIEKSDSLKIVFLYEYQIKGKSKAELLNTFTMELD